MSIMTYGMYQRHMTIQWDQIQLADLEFTIAQHVVVPQVPHVPPVLLGYASVSSYKSDIKFENRSHSLQITHLGLLSLRSSIAVKP
ncbi:hypothetical protein L2E82_29836 [Cichorium intybus]|uniref:Uncharacterized protein n=1 Tax=Cichorium intybus TaxID=13427 RepID=A0ACB9CYM0_CICIN|nr:hypothetical protein L2E82_29836 [Cichorium intybus]